MTDTHFNQGVFLVEAGFIGAMSLAFDSSARLLCKKRVCLLNDHLYWRKSTNWAVVGGSINNDEDGYCRRSAVHLKPLEEHLNSFIADFVLWIRSARRKRRHNQSSFVQHDSIIYLFIVWPFSHPCHGRKIRTMSWIWSLWRRM